MNILILNWKDIKHPQVGGAEIIVYELAKRLVKDGHKVTWFCRSFVGCSPEEIMDGIKIIRRGNLITTYLYAPIYYWTSSKKPDLVIDISNTIYWQTPVWAFASKKIAYLNQLAKDVFFYEFPRGISRLGIFFEKLQYLPYRWSKFVCYAKSTRMDLMNLGIPRNQIKIFTLGVDHKRYTPGKKSKTPLFICLNRLVNMKRTDLVVQAMSYVSKRFPEIKLVIIGTGYARKKLGILRDDLKLQNTVSFADENTWYFKKDKRDKKISLMQSAWALICPSVKEGWGMTVTECAACKTPSIVSNVTGLCDSVVDKVTGVVISANPPPEEIAKAIIKLANDHTLRTRLSSGAHQYSQKMNWEKCYQEFRDIIISA
ncbi:MAG: glycosyltransferase family 4 protein [Patescibacteria group bacterium]